MELFECVFFADAENPVGIDKMTQLRPEDMWTQAVLDMYEGFPPETVLPDNFPNLTLPNDPVFLNIEHWTETTPDPFVDTLDLFRSAQPSYRTGFYSVLPQRPYPQMPINQPPSSDVYKEWQAHNDMMLPIAPAADYVMPSIYTFTKDRGEWAQFAVHMTSEARRTGEKVIAFLMPYYHPHFEEMNYGPLDRMFWRFQLDTCRALCDGVVVFSRRMFEDMRPDLDWIDETRTFAQMLKNES